MAKSNFVLDPNWRQHATDRQWEKLETWARCGSAQKASVELGCDKSLVTCALRDVKIKAARAGYIPPPGSAFHMADPVPDGFVLKGQSARVDAAGNVQQRWDKTRIEGMGPEEAVRLPDKSIFTKISTLYDQDGRVSQQWVTEKPADAAREATIREGVRAFMADYEPIIPHEGPSRFDSDVIPWFQIGDAHIGMLAHEAETGANFDLKIAERELCAAFAILFDECAPRERCVINDLGDATHYENMMAVTEQSRHQLDADGRFPKMIGVYSRTMRFIVDRALERFRHVDVIINQGNHSRTNDLWMAELLRVAYAGTGRVNVLDNSSVFIGYRMGNTFVLTHHSDKTKPERLSQVMAHDFRQDWGETEYHYIDTGHLHHKWSARESAGCTIEMWNTLASRDKFNTEGGWRSLQSITRVDRSRTYGEVGRRVLPIGEIREAIKRGHGEGVYIAPERRAVHTV